jgi:hypothetical protein
MKFLVLTLPMEGIERKLPPEEFEAQIGWVRQQLDSGRMDCAYHGENHAVAIVNGRVSRGFGAALWNHAAG